MWNMRTCEPRLADSVRSELLPRRTNRENTTIKSFTAITSVVGKEIRFIGNAWEDESFRTDEEGNPIRDRRGNTISTYTVDEIGERDSELLIKAFGDGPDFLGWMLSEGISEQVARSVADQAARLTAELTAADLAAPATAELTAVQ